MIPVFIQLAKTMGIQASRLIRCPMRPLWAGHWLEHQQTYCRRRLPAQGLAFQFWVTVFGRVIWGAVFISLALLLPKRDSLASLLTDKSRMYLFTEAVIPPESNLIGREVTSVELFKRDGVRLIDVVRKEKSLRRNLKGELQQDRRSCAHR